MKDKDYITSKFDSENITAPASLSEEAIKSRLEQGTSVNNIVKINKNKKRILKPLGAFAACIAIVVTSVISGSAIHDARIEKAIAERKENGLVYFANYDELENFTGKLTENNKSGYGGLIAKNFGVLDYSKSAELIADSAAPESTGETSHSATYTQVEDVDEGDIVKTDGEYIYFINEGGDTLIIYSAKDGKTKLASKKFNEGDGKSFQEMYLDGDRVYLLGTEYNYDSDKDTDGSFIITLDVSDRSNIKELGTYSQSGMYSTSRMVDGCIYMISTAYTYNKKFVPCYGIDDGVKKIPAEDICAFDCCREPSYAIVGAVSTKSGKSTKCKIKAVMGGASNVYSTTENLYVACTDYRYSDASTKIIKFAFDGINIKEKTTGTVNGYTNNQWSFDEKDGYLRVATTVNKNGKEYNKLYILNKKLEKVGSVGGFARNEHIEAVRYIGDMAYVITYKTTDPLFIIDLSDPEDPKITGEVKIDGFSTNLIPVGEDKLMGVGYSTEENEWGEATNGVKLVLFDISDKNNPKVLDTKVYKSADSAAQESHKAIVQNTDENYLAIPINFNYYDEDNYTYDLLNGGAIVFTEKDGKIKIIKEFKSDIQSDRVVYIGNYIYTVDMMEDDINSFKLK